MVMTRVMIKQFLIKAILNINNQIPFEYNIYFNALVEIQQYIIPIIEKIEKLALKTMTESEELPVKEKIFTIDQ